MALIYCRVTFSKKILPNCVSSTLNDHAVFLFSGDHRQVKSFNFLGYTLEGEVTIDHLLSSRLTDHSAAQ